MAYSEAQKRASDKYRAKAYDVIQVKVHKGSRDKYHAQAAAHGMSLNAYIISLLDADAPRFPDACAMLADTIPD